MDQIPAPRGLALVKFFLYNSFLLVLFLNILFVVIMDCIDFFYPITFLNLLLINKKRFILFFIFCNWIIYNWLIGTLF